jgi:hypothetical protein
MVALRDWAQDRVVHLSKSKMEAKGSSQVKSSSQVKDPSQSKDSSEGIETPRRAPATISNRAQSCPTHLRASHDEQNKQQTQRQAQRKQQQQTSSAGHVSGQN